MGSGQRRLGQTIRKRQRRHMERRGREIWMGQVNSVVIKYH